MVIEIALFRVKAGVTDERVLEVSDALQRDVVKLEGYLGRQLCRSEDGQWADVVRWTGLEVAERAMREMEGHACMRAFMEIEEPGSTQLLHVRPVKEYEGSVREVAV